MKFEEDSFYSREVIDKVKFVDDANAHDTKAMTKARLFSNALLKMA